MHILPDRPVLTVPELAQRWAVAPLTIYRMLETGKLNGFKIGTSWRIRVDVVLNYETNTMPTS